jgi:Uma2 family endonuclease
MSLAAGGSEVEHEPQLMTVEEYLAFEEAAATKHEYVDGLVYAMAGGKQEHSSIAANVIGLLHAQLRGRACRVHTSDMAVRIESQGKTRFITPSARWFADRRLGDKAFRPSRSSS